MFLLLDIRNNYVTIAVIDAARDRRTTVTGERVGFRAFARAQTTLLRGKKPSCVAIVMNASADAVRDVSWSAVRAGVATANALAFAWSVPSVAVRVRGDESRSALAELARAVVKKAKKGHWVTAAYFGEPNITTAKVKRIVG